MRSFYLSFLLLFLLTENISSHINHYDNLKSLKYDLFRNDKLIGFHNYDFKREGNTLNIESNVKFKISKLGVDLYKYEAKSTEKYKSNKFLSFASTTLQNKKQKYVNISLNANKDALIIDGSSYQGPAKKDFIVGTWWNHEIIKAKAQISAISGRIIEQDVSFIGKEIVEINGKKYNTLHFKFTSSDLSLPDNKKLNTDIWYEENSYIWIKAAFEKRGYWEYRLKKIN
tara:strand:- start:27 stop:710 length:684 start_codon:yes stop_codon:yes gene_type:complete